MTILNPANQDWKMDVHCEVCNSHLRVTLKDEIKKNTLGKFYVECVECGNPLYVYASGNQNLIGLRNTFVKDAYKKYVEQYFNGR